VLVVADAVRPSVFRFYIALLARWARHCGRGTAAGNGAIGRWHLLRRVGVRMLVIRRVSDNVPPLAATVSYNRREFPQSVAFLGELTWHPLVGSARHAMPTWRSARTRERNAELDH